MAKPNAYLASLVRLHVRRLTTQSAHSVSALQVLSLRNQRRLGGPHPSPASSTSASSTSPTPSSSAAPGATPSRSFFNASVNIPYDAASASAAAAAAAAAAVASAPTTAPVHPLPGRAAIITTTRKLPNNPSDMVEGLGEEGTGPDASGGGTSPGYDAGGASGGANSSFVPPFPPRPLSTPISTGSSSSSSSSSSSASTTTTTSILSSSTSLAGGSYPSPWLDPGRSGMVIQGDPLDDPFSLPKKSFCFEHAAYGFPKPDRQRKAPSRTTVPLTPPVPSTKYLSVACGEDAYFHRHDALGVADGVGGWSGTKGANPGEFSRKIMHYACAELEKYDDVDEDAFARYYEVEPIDILERSYTLAARDAQDEGIVGSTTACLAILRDDELRVANLGDCGLTVVRAGHFVFRTEEQQHSFNFPYQLGTGSPDQPSDAQSFRLRVQRGDVIILGSDGIFDNLFDEDILETVTACAVPVGLATGGPRKSRTPSPPPPSPSSSPNSPPPTPRPEEKVVIDARKVSQVLAQRAKDVSEDTRCGASPFQSRAIAEGLYYSGGKVDDISVVVAVVADSEDSPDRR